MARGTRSCAMLVLALASMLAVSYGCVELIGHATDSLVKHDNSTHWDYAFVGEDWVGTDAAGKPWVCKTGKSQSPINIPPLDKLRRQPSRVKTKFMANPKIPANVADKPVAWVWNNGHTIQVQDFSYDLVGVHVPRLPNVTSVLANKAGEGQAFKWLHVPALQFHFHTTSEHQFDGMSSSLELHIVHKSAANVYADCPAGCYIVVGIMIRVREGPDHPHLAAVFDTAPFREGEGRPLPMKAVLDFSPGKIMPAHSSYVTYKGSLTTPPCSEGLLWHVLTEPIYISPRQLKQYRDAVGSKTCTGEKGSPDAKCTLAAWGDTYRLPQPIFKRPVFFSG